MTLSIERIGRVALVRLNRPQKLNALDSQVLHDLVSHLQPLGRDTGVGCIVLTGTPKAFAAGADIGELQGKSHMDMVHDDFFGGWDAFAALHTPRIAAVAGYALGGGCELAMMCDLIFAADTAMFGQPKIKLGTMPAMGGSQRLTRLIGRARAMDMILTGRMMDAAKALRAGLVSRVFAADSLIEDSMAVARTIAGYGKTAVMAAREAVDRADETTLREGILFERRAYHALFATQDQKEGMAAFAEKRAPVFRGM